MLPVLPPPPCLSDAPLALLSRSFCEQYLLPTPHCNPAPAIMSPSISSWPESLSLSPPRFLSTPMMILFPLMALGRCVWSLMELFFNAPFLFFPLQGSSQAFFLKASILAGCTHPTIPLFQIAFFFKRSLLLLCEFIIRPIPTITFSALIFPIRLYSDAFSVLFSLPIFPLAA